MTKGTRWGWRINVTPRPLITPGKDPVPIVQEAGWAPGPVWTGAENLAPTGFRSPDRPARSQSLYRLSYPAHLSSVHTCTLSELLSSTTKLLVRNEVDCGYWSCHNRLSIGSLKGSDRIEIGAVKPKLSEKLLSNCHSAYHKNKKKNCSVIEFKSASDFLSNVTGNT